VSVRPSARTLDGLVVYHFAASLYFANANHFFEEVLGFVADGLPPVRWIGLDASAVADVDYSGAQTLRELARSLHERGVRLVFAEVEPDVLASLHRYGLSDVCAPTALYDTVADLITAFQRAT
jgi:sulfate permease, SulP family